VVTVLAPHLGYERAAEIARELRETQKTLREIVRERGWMSDAELERVLDVEAMTRGGLLAP
jgi:fumarate hydratase class II